VIINVISFRAVGFMYKISKKGALDSYIMATSCSGGRSRREPPTTGKQLVNFITCGCESSAPFFDILYINPTALFRAIEMRRKRNIGAECDCIANSMVTFLKFLFTYSMKFDEIYSIKSISSQISVKKKI
jgi:hypothetical protein